MIPKSGNRFSEQIMLTQECKVGEAIPPNQITL